MEARLYVGNLAFATTETELRTLFAQAGSVSACDIITDRVSGQSKGFGFVTMSNRSEAQKAISMFNAFSLNDRQLTVNMAKPREERSGSARNPRRY